MMGFGNPITGGQGALVRPAIKSPNFVTLVSGWSINRDGSAEFNSVVVRGEVDIPFSDGSYLRLATGVYNGTSGVTLNGPLFTLNPKDVVGHTWIPAVLGTDLDQPTIPELLLASPTEIGRVQSSMRLIPSSPGTGTPAFIILEALPGDIQLAAGGCSLELTGDQVPGANVIRLASDLVWIDSIRVIGDNEDGINVANVADTVAAAPYQAMAGTHSLALTKTYTNTRLEVILIRDMFVTAQPTAVQLGVSIAGTNYDLITPGFNFNVANSHTQVIGRRYIPAGIAAGPITVAGIWRRTGGAGTVTSDVNGCLMLAVRECV